MSAVGAVSGRRRERALQLLVESVSAREFA
jgi:hypothetical protein